MTDLTLAFFGNYDVAIKATAVTGFESDKVRALLAYLSVEARPHRREALAGRLWPDLPEVSARHNLSQVLFNLRQVIGDRHAQPPFLLVSRDTIHFNPASSHTLDVAVFNELLDCCAVHPHTAITHCDECVQRLQQAAKLYRGAFLHQFFLHDSAPFEEWALLQREQHHRRALHVLTQLAAYHEAKGDWAAAVREQSASQPLAQFVTQVLGETISEIDSRIAT